MRKIIFDPEAASEFHQAVACIESARVGFGEQLNKSTEEIVDRIATNPEHFPQLGRHLRKALIRRFEYLVIFAALDETIYVVAFAHAKRRPGYWRERLPHSSS